MKAVVLLFVFFNLVACKSSFQSANPETAPLPSGQGASADEASELEAIDIIAMSLIDVDSGSSQFTNARIVNLNITDDSRIRYWCVSETQSSQMRNTNSPCVGGAGTNSGWLQTRPTQFELSASNGSKTVYVWLADSRGRVRSSSTSYSITLDTVNPVATIASAPPSSTTLSTANISISIADTTSGVNNSNPSCTLNGANVACTIVGSSLNVNLTGLSVGSHSLQARVFDRAGNSTLTNAITWSRVSDTASITLAWDPNSEADLIGYRVYYGTTPGAYLQAPGAGISVGPSSSPTTVVSNLVRGQSYYFVVTAYTSSGESVHSNQVQAMVP